jgi:hypothetical protein
MQTTLTPTDDDEEGSIPCLIVRQEDQSLAPSPTFTRTVPLLKPFEIVEAICLHGFEDAKASDSWFHDMVREKEETRRERNLL